MSGSTYFICHLFIFEAVLQRLHMEAHVKWRNTKQQQKQTKVFKIESIDSSSVLFLIFQRLNNTPKILILQFVLPFSSALMQTLSSKDVTNFLVISFFDY